jgi:26S proteasome non-ATPase regulatory subunit 9
MSRKEGIEAELDAQVSILRANNSTLESPLVDNEGFPRDDLGAENSLSR